MPSTVPQSRAMRFRRCFVALLRVLNLSFVSPGAQWKVGGGPPPSGPPGDCANKAAGDLDDSLGAHPAEEAKRLCSACVTPRQRARDAVLASAASSMEGI